MPSDSPAYYDAHCHLQDERLRDWLEENAGLIPLAGIRRIVVNGTRPEDWERVRELAERYAFVKPSYGLHPWYVNTARSGWEARLEELLADPGAAVGEVGLDRWIEGYDIEAQKEAFRRQCSLAATLERPLAIHCLRAWGILYELLKTMPLPRKGFLLHSYGGPTEMVGPLLELGAWFSFSAYFALEAKEKKRRSFMEVPLERLLVETDAPDMLGPESTMVETLTDGEGRKINSPLNLPRIYEYAAKMKNMDTDAFVDKMSENFRSFFE